MPVVYVKFITRKMVRDNRDARFVFGDNLRRTGFGGQAMYMRGEPNAIGVATKVAPGINEEDYFTDSGVHTAAALLDIASVNAAINAGLTVYVPVDGIGTGLAELPKRAPRLAQRIVNAFREMPGETCPWPDVI